MGKNRKPSQAMSKTKDWEGDNVKNHSDHCHKQKQKKGSKNLGAQWEQLSFLFNS
jgi:hypothetical protein